MKTSVPQLILSMLTQVQTEIREIRQTDIPALQVSHAELNQRVKDEAKFHSRAYARVYGAISLVIAVTSLAVAYFKH